MRRWLSGYRANGHEPRASGRVEFRVAGRTLSGTVLRYGDLSPEHRERFAPGAFAPVPDVPLNLQHDRSVVLLPAGRYALTDSPRALEVRAELPAESAALKLVRRGALSGFSIEFHSRAERREAGVRVIESAALVGVALVDVPSYRGAPRKSAAAATGADDSAPSAGGYRPESGSIAGALREIVLRPSSREAPSTTSPRTK